MLHCRPLTSAVVCSAGRICVLYLKDSRLFLPQVIVKDVVSKVLITQFRAHKSPISALSFDPSGILLATASVHGHNVNVFRIIPERTGGSGASRSYVHLYRLQRGLTDAVRLSS